MPHSFRKHDVVKHEDQVLIRPKSGTRVQQVPLRSFPMERALHLTFSIGSSGRSPIKPVRDHPHNGVVCLVNLTNFNERVPCSLECPSRGLALLSLFAPTPFRCGVSVFALTQLVFYTLACLYI